MSNTSKFELSNRINVLNPCSDIDHLYGPYWGTSADIAIGKAKTEFGPLLNGDYNKEMVGRTIGVIVSANETDNAAVIEYWWQYVPAEGDQPAKYDFVEKTAEIDLSGLDVECATSVDIISNVTVGAISQNGKVDKGTTLEQFIKQLLVKLLIPTGSSVSGSISGVTTQTVEVGTTITPTIKASFKDGSVNNYGAGVINPTSKSLGCAATQTQYKRIINGAETTTIGTPVTGTTGYQDSYKIKHENVRYCADISYSAPTFTEPLDSEGDKHTLSELNITSAAGTLTTGNTNIITGEFKYYAGVYDVNPEDKETQMMPSVTDVRTAFDGNVIESYSTKYPNTVAHDFITKAKSATDAGESVTDNGIIIKEDNNRGAVLYIPNEYSLVSAVTDNRNVLTAAFQANEKEVQVTDKGGTSRTYKRYHKWDSLPSTRTICFRIVKD
jgi:hypothetical protein